MCIVYKIRLKFFLLETRIMWVLFEEYIPWPSRFPRSCNLPFMWIKPAARSTWWLCPYLLGGIRGNEIYDCLCASSPDLAWHLSAFSWLPTVWFGGGCWAVRDDYPKQTQTGGQTAADKPTHDHCCRMLSRCSSAGEEQHVENECPRMKLWGTLGWGVKMRTVMASRLANKRIGWIACPLLGHRHGPTHVWKEMRAIVRVDVCVERRTKADPFSSTRGVYVMHSGGMHMCALRATHTQSHSHTNALKERDRHPRSVCEQALDCVIIIVSSVALCSRCLSACIVTVAVPKRLDRREKGVKRALAQW